jgi:hypothetical protein
LGKIKEVRSKAALAGIRLQLRALGVLMAAASIAKRVAEIKPTPKRRRRGTRCHKGCGGW